MAPLRFEGDQDFPLSIDVVWTKLSDVRFLISCIPDVESVSKAEATEGVVVIKPGFAFVRGTLEVTLQLLEAQPSSSVRIQARSKGIGSSSQLEAALTFVSQDAGSRVNWSAEIKELGGLLKAVPQGLIKAAAQKVIADVWTSVGARVVE